MKKAWVFLGILFSLGLLLLGRSAVLSAQDEASLIQTEINYEKSLESRLQEIVDKILGPDKARVAVKVYLNQEKTTAENETHSPVEDKGIFGSQDFFMPGVPRPKKADEKAPTNRKVETVVKLPSLQKISVTIFMADTIPEIMVDTVKGAIADFLQMNPARGDTLTVKKIQFTNSALQPYLTPKWILIAFGSLIVIVFLFGPLGGFLRNLPRMIGQGKNSEINMQGGGKGAGGVEGAAAIEAKAKEEEEKKRKAEEEAVFHPFAFIKKENLKSLFYIIQDERPDVVALIISYLPFAESALVLSSLSPEMQFQVAMNMAKVKQTSKETILKIEEDIKKKIDFLVGGIESFVEILNAMDNETRANILTSVEKQSPALADRLRRELFTVEDIPGMPDIALQSVLREIKTESLAKALKGVPQPVLDKVFANLSEGAKALLQEAIDLAVNVTKEETEEAQRALVELVRTMERDGRIVLKEKKKSRFIEIDGKPETLQLASPEQSPAVAGSVTTDRDEMERRIREKMAVEDKVREEMMRERYYRRREAAPPVEDAEFEEPKPAKKKVVPIRKSSDKSKSLKILQ